MSYRMSEERRFPEKLNEFPHPHFINFFSFLAGDIGQMNLPVGMQFVNFEECSGLTGTADILG